MEARSMKDVMRMETALQSASELPCGQMRAHLDPIGLNLGSLGSIGPIWCPQITKCVILRSDDEYDVFN